MLTPTRSPPSRTGPVARTLASRAVVRRLLWRSALAGGAADRVIDELRAGHAVVLVDAVEIAASDARAQLEELAHAA